MIVITPTPTLPSPHLAEIENLVQCLEAMETEATRLMLEAYATQIRELAHGAMHQLDFARGCIRDIPGEMEDTDNWGEGYWDVALAEMGVKHVGRYAQEARYWLHAYRVAEQRIAEGKPAFLWANVDKNLATEEAQVEHERSTMESSQ